MNDILLGALILFSGFVPVAIALWYSNKLLKEAKELHALAQSIADQMPKNMADWLLGERFTDHLKMVFNGIMGAKVKGVMNEVKEEGRLAGLPMPVKSVVAKGVGNFLSGYGVPKKTITDGIMSLLNRPSKEQLEQQNAMIRQYAGVDQSVVIDPYGPKV